MGYTKKELNKLLEITNDCLAVEDCHSYRIILDKISTLIDFNKAIICTIQTQSNGSMSFDNIINHSFDKQWIAVYTDNRFIDIDPTLNLESKHHNISNWEQTLSQSGESDSAMLDQFYQLSQDYGLSSGLTSISKSRTAIGKYSVISIQIDSNKIELTNRLLNILAPHIHETFSRNIFNNNFNVDLTVREKDVLNWIKEGKTTWEISVILAISERTVKFHLSNIFGKLNVTNRSHALAKAMRYGII